jgi:hypothetical protein
MANLWVSEYSWPAKGEPIAHEPAFRTTRVVFTTATQSPVFLDDTHCVRLVADADCHVLFGRNPTAVVQSQRIPAGAVEWRQVTPGDRLSVYDGVS